MWVQPYLNHTPLRRARRKALKFLQYLFNLYTNDIPIHQHTLLAIFADDTAVLARHKKNIAARNLVQDHLNSIDAWFQKWKIKTNPSKCIAITFNKAHSTPTIPQLEVNKHKLNWANEAKYLGVILDKKLNYSKHVKSKILKIIATRKQLYPLLNNNSPLSQSNKLLLYKSLIRPKFTYACMIWGSVAAGHLYAFQKHQNRVVKQITNSPYYVRAAKLHKELKLDTIGNYIKKVSIKFYGNLHKVPNKIIQELEKLDDISSFGPSRPFNSTRIPSFPARRYNSPRNRTSVPPPLNFLSLRSP